jgi:hypothetical protein
VVFAIFEENPILQGAPPFPVKISIAIFSEEKIIITNYIQNKTMKNA